MTNDEIKITEQTAVEPAETKQPPKMTTLEYLEALDKVIVQTRDIKAVEAFLDTQGTEPLKSVEAYPKFQKLVCAIPGKADPQRQSLLEYQLALIDLFCRNGLDPNNRKDETVQPILIAVLTCAVGNPKAVKALIDLLLKHGADPNAVHREFDPKCEIVWCHKPLAWAISKSGYFENTDIVQTLIDAGAEKDSWVAKKDDLKISMMWMALSSSNAKWAQRLLATVDMIKEWDHCQYAWSTPEFERLREAKGDALETFLKEIREKSEKLSKKTVRIDSEEVASEEYPSIDEILREDPRTLQYIEKELVIKRYCEGLMAAVHTGSLEAVDKFLSSHLQEIAYLKSKEAYQALLSAIQMDNLGIVTLLLKRGIAPDNIPGDPFQYGRIVCPSALTVAMMQTKIRKKSDNNDAIVEVLLQHGADPNAKYTYDSNFATPFWAALRSRNEPLQARLLKAGANPNQNITYQFVTGRSEFLSLAPLHILAHQGECDLIRALLKYQDLDLDKLGYLNDCYWSMPVLELCSSDGRTALMLAAARGHVDVINILATAGAKVNQTNDDGETALMVVVEQSLPHDDKKLAVVNALLTLGADVNRVDKRGKSALMRAAQAGNLAIVNALLANGADVNLIDEDRANAYAFAENDEIRAAIGRYYVADLKVTFWMADHFKKTTEGSSFRADFSDSVLCEMNTVYTAIDEYVRDHPTSPPLPSSPRPKS